MGEIKLTINEIGFIATFQGLTKATAKDCIINDDNGVVFIVSSGQMGLAIGKSGKNIKNASRILKKEVSVAEYSDDPVKFIKNVMYPIRPKSINIEGTDSRRIAKVSVDRKDRARVIGARGKNIHSLKNIVLRHHDLEDVIIA